MTDGGERAAASAALRAHLAGSVPEAGLCAGCRNVRVVHSGKGSTFYLCELSKTDPAFPKYPRIPVLRCRGYLPDPAATAG